MLRQFFAAARSRRLALDSLVKQVAEASVESVARLVGDRVAGMSPCEARGYVRARSSVEIRRQVKAALSHRPVGERQWESLVISRAVEAAPALVLRRLAAMKTPTRSSQRRAA
jgi:hypothetical protein